MFPTSFNKKTKKFIQIDFELQDIYFVQENILGLNKNCDFYYIEAHIKFDDNDKIRYCFLGLGQSIIYSLEKNSPIQNYKIWNEYGKEKTLW